MTPTERADYILEQYWNGNIPVNPMSIASKLNISVAYDKTIQFSGWYSQETQVISINPDDRLQRQRFTIAHEIGHAVMGHGSSPRDTSQLYSKYNYLEEERDANDFAAELLMPNKIVNFLIHEKKIVTINELCSMLDVSQSAMRIKLERLGYLS